ncbi:Chromosome-partitioning ATPase Soj [compost metagenome]
MKEQLTTLFTQCVNNSQSMRERLQKDAIGTASPTERIITRRFNVSETAELVGVARAAIDQAEKDGRLPPPERNEHGAKLGYTLYQIQQIRELFGTALVQPHAVTMAVASNKGGAYKTSVAVHAAQWFALLGYRVLLIDSDPQGTAGDYFGWSSRWVDGGKTIVPWMLGREQSLAYAIHPTCWPGTWSPPIRSCSASTRKWTSWICPTRRT